MPVTRADELEALAERVEKLTGPDRDVEAAILEAVNLPAGPHGYALAYTSSLDAAMSLVPAGYGWIAGSGRTRSDEPLGGAQITTLNGKTVIAEAEAATPALALTAACLRAHASIIREAGR